MEYVFSFIIQIVLTLLMTVVFAFVLSLIVFVVAYIFSSKENRNLICASSVMAAVIGSVVFGLSLFAINVFVPYYGGVDYGFSDYHKVPLVADCSLVSEDDAPYSIVDVKANVVYVDSVASLAVINKNLVAGRMIDDVYFVFNGAKKDVNYCAVNDSVYRRLGMAKLKLESPNDFYYHSREVITIRETDYFGNWAALASIVVFLLAFMVFRFLCKRTTLNTETYVEGNLMKRYEQIKDKE